MPRQTDAKTSRREFLRRLPLWGAVPMVLNRTGSQRQSAVTKTERRFHYVHIDVFASRRFEGNPLAVFTDAAGLADGEMQDLARETGLQETTFVFRRPSVVEAREGIRVRIFNPEREIPFGGHPTLGTATVLLTEDLVTPARKGAPESISTILLDLKVGKVPVFFTKATKTLFGEMRQVPPIFGPMHDRAAVAQALGLPLDDIESDVPIQTISTGLPFAILPLKSLKALQLSHVDLASGSAYLSRQATVAYGFYFVTRDTGDAKTILRARAVSPGGEDPATGSAAGCASAWMVKYGIAHSDQRVAILQGVEIKRPSQLYVRSTKSGDVISNVRVGGTSIQIMQGEAYL